MLLDLWERRNERHESGALLPWGLLVRHMGSRTLISKIWTSNDRLSQFEGMKLQINISETYVMLLNKFKDC